MFGGKNKTGTKKTEPPNDLAAEMQSKVLEMRHHMVKHVSSFVKGADLFIHWQNHFLSNSTK